MDGVPAPVIQPVKLKNIIATLPGSDPALRDTYILLTAHYDHIGISPRGEGDRLNNGANDDASGVATVLALAESFAELLAAPGGVSLHHRRVSIRVIATAPHTLGKRSPRHHRVDQRRHETRTPGSAPTAATHR